MLNALMKRKTVASETPAPSAPASPESLLAQTRQKIATLTAEIARLRAEAERCRAEAATHAATRVAVAQARQRLEDLHAARAAGELVDDGDLAGAETAHTAAIAAAVKAAPAEVGASRAADQFEMRAGEIMDQITEARAVEADYVREILAGRVADSHARFDSALQTYAAAYCAHHGTVTAIAEAARSLGIAPHEIDAFAVGGAACELEFIECATRENMHARRVLNVFGEIQAATADAEAKLRAELGV